MAALPRIDPALRTPLLSAALGILAAAGLAMAAPQPYGLAAGLAALGLACLSAMLALDARRRQEADALAHNVGELNVRLGATRIKLEGLQSRIDSEPLREADIAPTRQSLAELTAEVGLLGGVLRDVAQAVSDHEGRIATLAEAPARPAEVPPAARPAPQPPALVAKADELVDREFEKRDEAQLAAIMAAFSASGLEVHLQPIAALPQRRTIGYEALARLKLADGTMLLPSEFIPALQRAGKGAMLDAQVLTQTLAIAGHLNARGNDHFIGLNLSAGTWGEARALGSIARALETYRAQATRIVIEIPQRIWRDLDPARLGIIGAMSAGGVRFALDQVADLRVDPVALADRGVRFVKVPAAVLAGFGERSPGLDIDMADLAQLLRRAGIELIGEKAESDRLVADLIDLDIRLAQGFAISQPRPVKPDVFQPATETPAPGPAQAQPASQPDTLVDNAPIPSEDDRPRATRLPLRAVLRRA